MTKDIQKTRLFSSCSIHDNCAYLNNYIKLYLFILVEFWAHEHSYERLWPIFDYKVMNGSYEEPYTNPGAPIHVGIINKSCITFSNQLLQ